MSCTFSKEALALHAEADVTDDSADVVRAHLGRCEECRQFFDELQARQTLLKSLRGEGVTASARVQMRRAVMSRINAERQALGWGLRLERMLVFGYQQRAYAMAMAILLGIVSVSVLAQMRHTGPVAAVARFEQGNALVRPEGYQAWMAVASEQSVAGERVYINPVGAREYARTGSFPEGTVVIWEPGRQRHPTAHGPHKASGLLVSVKDRTRFADGWGFFDFSASEGAASGGSIAVSAEPESSGCLTCHRENAETDHVFTQAYPALRTVRDRALVANQPSRG